MHVLTIEAPKRVRYVAVMYQDEAGNWGKLNNEPIKVTGTPPPQRKAAGGTN